MNAADKIRLRELLRERERLFARINAIESRIDTILGAPYPYPAPPSLPSFRPEPKKKTKSKPVKPIRIRRLKTGLEDAYLVEYARDGETRQTIQRDPKLIQALYETQPPNLTITRVSTVAFDDDGQRRVIALLAAGKPPSKDERENLTPPLPRELSDD